MNRTAVRIAVSLAVIVAAGSTVGCGVETERAAQGPPPAQPSLDLASVRLLRGVSAAEARRATRDVRRCERLAAAVTAVHRVSVYRACAAGPLGRAGASAAVNSRMLLAAAGTSPGWCASLVRGLAGESVTLGAIARSTLSTALGLTWHEVRAGSRAVRGMAREVLARATARRWARACELVSSAPGRRAL
jgi:hypothetical protein